MLRQFALCFVCVPVVPVVEVQQRRRYASDAQSPSGASMLRAERVQESVDLPGTSSSFGGESFSRQKFGHKQHWREFPRKRGDHFLDRGLTGDAKRIAAEAEAEYVQASQALSSTGGGLLEDGEGREVLDEDGTSPIRVRRLAVPFGQTFVPSSKERFALRGQIGQMSQLKEEGWMLPERRAITDRCLLLERQLDEVIDNVNMPLMSKAEVCKELASDAMAQRLLLQPRTWDAMFELWGQAHAAPLIERYSNRHRQSSLLPPRPDDERLLQEERKDAPPQQPLTFPFLDMMRMSYLYMRQTFTAPTASVMEHMMCGLAFSGLRDKKTQHLAHRIFLDSDRFVVLPTRTTYAAYFDVCSRCEKMDFAVSRFADAVDRLFIEPDASMATALLRGLNENGLVEEAVAMLARLQHIPADTQFLNVSMEVMLLTNDPRALLAAYESTCRNGGAILPSAETFTLMLLACEKLADWSPTRDILSEMQRLRVKGDANCLNLLLKGLLNEKLTSFAHQLYVTMQLKNVPVWPKLEASLPRAVRSISKLSRRAKKILLKNNRRGGSFALSKDLVQQAQQFLDDSDKTSSNDNYHGGVLRGDGGAPYQRGGDVERSTQSQKNSNSIRRDAAPPHPSKSTMSGIKAAPSREVDLDA